MATPERQVGIEVGGTTFSLYLRALYEKGAKLSPDLRLRAVRREGNTLVAELRNEYTLKIETREVDQVVAEHGTLPRDELYFALKPLSRNRGEVDYHALVGGRAQAIIANPAGGFPALPRRRCGGEPQHSRGDLRFPAALHAYNL